MLATRQKVLRRFWYPVMPAVLLDQGPRKFVLLGENLVLWRDPFGAPACIANRCCHRTAELSAGFVSDGNIVCGYHGWTFDATGRCVRIPQRLETAVAERIAIPGYRADERYGHVWVALEAPLAPIPDIPEAALPEFRRVDQFYEEWKIGAFRLMENSFDAAHVAYTHRNTFGDVANPVPSKSEMVEHDWVFVRRMETPVKNPESGRKALGIDSDRTVRRTESDWFMPFCRRAAISYPNGLTHTIFTAATPMTDDRTMVVQFCYRNDSEADTPAAEVVAWDRRITLEDRFVLEGTEPDVPLAVHDGEEMHMHTDRPGVLMRKKLRALLAAHGEAEIRAAH